MYTKIREYVNFKLRNDYSSDVEEKKEEIISNIIERYDALYEKTQDESYSYIEAIKNIGEFSEEKEENQYKPQFAEMLLVSATVLSVISLIATFLNGVAGIIVIGVSMSLYAVGAMYLYQYSKFVQSEEYDITKYHAFIDKSFSYAMTNFTFWAISLSLIFSRIIYGFLISLLVLTVTGDPEAVLSILLISVIAFLIALTIVGAVFIGLYRKLMKKYTDLTGKEQVITVGQRVKQFMGKSSSEKGNIFLSSWFYPIFHFIIVIFLIADIIHIYDRTYNPNIVYNELFLIENFTLIFLYVAITFLHIAGRIKHHMIVPLFTLGISITGFIFWLIMANSYYISSFNGEVFFFVGIIFLFLTILDFAINRKIK